MNWHRCYNMSYEEEFLSSYPKPATASTCKWRVLRSYNDANGEKRFDIMCSECGHVVSKPLNYYPNYCEECGLKSTNNMR